MCWLRSVIIVSLSLGYFLCCDAAAMSVTFLNPGKPDEVYWLTASNSMLAAAKDLDVKLEVMYANRNHLNTLTQAKQLATRELKDRPDYVILSNDHAVGFEVIRILDAANIKTFLAFSGLREQSERLLSTVPRQHFPGWLGSLEPRAEEAGYLTARALIQHGQQNHMQGSDGRLHMLAIAGDRSTPASLKRNEGMRRAVAEAKDVVLDQEVYAEWSRAKAQEQSEWLFQRHPQARLIWAGSDLMAFGAMDSWKNKGGQPGKDAYFSAVNTSSEALAALESGSLTALAGGHFIAGAFGLVMLYDYHHGKDFKDEGLELDRSMFILFSKDEARRFQRHFGRLDFSQVDFKKFSKVLNPKLKKYDFNFRQILTQVEKHQ